MSVQLDHYTNSGYRGSAIYLDLLLLIRVARARLVPSLQYFPALFSRACAQVAITVIVDTDALLPEIPEQLDAPLREDRGVGQVKAAVPDRCEDRGGHALGSRVADPFGLSATDCLGKALIRLFDIFDGRGPGFGEGFECP
jgi:hypothetical protein